MLTGGLAPIADHAARSWLLGCLILVGCAQGAAPAGAGGAMASAAGTSGAAASGPSPAGPPSMFDPSAPVYEVPVSAALMPYARYAIGAVDWVAKNGERKLEYTLPAELIGRDQRLELKGPESSTATWSLRGEAFGTADCALRSGLVVCEERLAGIPIDVAAVEARVSAGELAAQRLEVTKVFNGDPIGILRFKP